MSSKFLDSQWVCDISSILQAIFDNSPNSFFYLLTMGITAQVIIQVLLNLAVVSNTFPSTGISLPFFSYGGTSLLILLAEMGIVLSISRYSYIEQG